MTADMVTVMRIECSPSEAADLRELLESLDPVFHKLTKYEEQQLNRWTTMLAALNLPERQPTTP